MTRSYCLALQLGCMYVCSVVSDSVLPYGLYPTGLLCPWNSPGENTGVGCHFLLQGIFLSQELNWGLLHCRQIPYQLSHQGSPGVKHMPIIYPSHFSSPRVTRPHEHTKTCTHLPPATSPTVAQNWKPSKNPSTGEWTNCHRSIQWKSTQE